MKYFGNGLSELHKDLSAIIRSNSQFEEAKRLFLKLHSMLHLSAVSDTEQNEVEAAYSRRPQMLPFRIKNKFEYSITRFFLL